MKKLIWLIICLALLSGCGDKETNEQTTLPKGVAGVDWFHYDEERDYKLFFGEDGTISYYSPSAGNPYKDFDLCENFSYNAESHEFIFKNDSCTIKFIDISADGKTLILIVNGEKITFIREDN